jgi:hypothetical protein
MRESKQEKADRIAVVRRVAKRLHAAEAAIDQAIIAMSELNRELPGARIEAGLSAIVGQEAFSCSAGALAHLVESRARTVDAHAALANTQSELGLGALAMGDGWKINEKKFARLSVVDVAA